MSAESTRKLLGNLFELQDLGAQDLKDIAEPVRARVLRASSVESRFEAFEYADQEVCDICTPLAVTVRCVEIGRPPSDLYPSWSAAGGVGCSIETGSDAGKVFLSASSSASSWCLRASFARS